MLRSNTSMLFERRLNRKDETMQLVCPKCGFSDRVRTSHCLMRPVPMTCRNCATRYLVNWKIRLPQDSAIICSWCAKKQADSPRCTYCGRLFYGYSPAKWEQAGHGPSQTETGSANFAVLRSKPVRFRIITACLVLLSIVAFLSGASHNRKNTERQYLTNYVLAIYGIKSGMELCGRSCDGIIDEWKKGKGSDIPEISREEKENMAIVKGEIDQVMRKLEPPPEKYAPLSTKLQSMYGNYLKLNDLANAPLWRLASFESKVEEARDNFSGEIADLKSNMPDQLVEELKRSGTKYNLSFIK